LSAKVPRAAGTVDWGCEVAGEEDGRSLVREADVSEAEEARAREDRVA